jgi:hypothetical protein
MIIRPVQESKELRILRYLNNRMNLSELDKNYYLYLEKGHEGEQCFAVWIKECLSDDFLILNSLLLEINRSVFQIDNLIITRENLFLNEVKNFEGDYYIENGIWYNKISGKERKNPIDQLKRSESLLRQLLQEIGYRITVEPNVIFVNSAFTLYKTPLNQPIIHPTQIKRFIKKINLKNSKLNHKHTKLAESLLTRHLSESAFNSLPKFSYEQLKKGIYCAKCNSYNVDYKNNKLKCNDCGTLENGDLAVLRSVVELNTLFPNFLITTNAIHDWCMIVDSKKTIRRVLAKNYQQTGIGKGSFYVIPQVGDNK